MTNCTFCKKDIPREDESYGPVQAPVCWDCWLNGSAACPNPDCDNGKLTCDTCGGGGWVITKLGADACGWCGGSGVFSCDTCDGKGTIAAENLYRVSRIANTRLDVLFPQLEEQPQ